MIGRTLGNYRVIDKLGEGGMGTVYLAEDARLKRKVALKFLPSELQANEQYKLRLMQEARSAAAIDHPFICKIYETCTEGDCTFIAMEYVDGQTLEARLEQGPLSVRETLSIATETAQALERAHSEHVIHRDLKPSNIMLTPDGHAKVMDFGLAKRVGESAGPGEETVRDLTREGTVLGTVPYMSPEQVRGEPLDERSDIFSLGIILYEMAARLHPFRQSTAVETAEAILNREQEPLSEHSDTAPPALTTIVNRMLEKDKERRYQSVGDVTAGLHSLAAVPAAGPAAGLEKWRTPVFGVVVLGLLAMVVATVDWPTTPLTPGRPRLAVLPFKSLSGGQQDEVYSDGLTESLTTQLGKLSALAVTSSTSAMVLKDTTLSAAEVGVRLGIDYFVSGSFLKSGDRCSTTVTLVRVSDDTQVWGDEFERPWDDILALRNEISTTVVEKVAGALGSEKALLSEIPTRNVAAYEALLQAQHHVRRFRNFDRETDARSAETFLKEALRLDPDYVDARLELAKLYWHEQTSGSPHRDQGWDRLEKAQEFAREVLEINDCNGDANAVAAGVFRWTPSPNRQTVEEELRLGRRGVDCDPNSPLARQVLNTIYFRRGLYEAALAQVMEWTQLDPLVVTPFQAAAHHFRYVGRLDDALTQANIALSIVPQSSLAHLAVGEALFFKGILDEAESRFLEGLALASTDNRPLFEVALATIAAARGDREFAAEVARRHRPSKGALVGAWSHLYQYLCILADERELALERIETDTHTNYRVLVTDLTMRELKDDPRFQALLKREWERWQTNTIGVLPSLAAELRPPDLPTPDEFLASN